MPNFFDRLKIDSWYMTFVYLGGILFILSLFVPTEGISNKQLIIFSFGLFCIGVGEWKNHKFLNYIKPPNIYTGPVAHIQTKIRSPDLLGWLFDLIGIFCLIIFLVDLVGLWHL